MVRSVLGVLLLTLFVGPLGASSFGLTGNDVRAGESVDGFPNWGERLILAWINRARVDPQIEMAKCGAACAEAACYKPVPPLTWSLALNRAARFHADEMRKQRYFSHQSKCKVVPEIDSLYPVGCDGSASCACVGGTAACPNGDCTGWSRRIILFGVQPHGEIIASGADPNGAFYMWLYERASQNVCSFNIQNGHRWMILTAPSGVGTGFVDDGRLAVGEFGSAAAPYPIPSGTHYPRQEESVEMWANWYDTAAPKSASVIVDGTCTSMTLKRGTGKNGAWMANVSGVGNGCHRYYFSFIDSAGREVTYPATGSLGIGCEEWNSSRATATCSGTTTPVTPAPTTRRRTAGRH